MNTSNKDISPFVYPDPITGPEKLSGATFLWFNTSLFFTLPPQVVIPDSYQLLPLIETRHPVWASTFMSIFNAWRTQQERSQRMLQALEPLRRRFAVIWLVYPADSAALERASTLASSTDTPIADVGRMVDPLNASGELIRHIMLEAFLAVDKDIEALFNYCGRMFGAEPIEHLLAKAYMLRLPMLADLYKRNMPVLLTNERLIDYLASLPVEIEEGGRKRVDEDVIAWELFRQILSPRLDPLNIERSKLIVELLDSRGEQIRRLRSKCEALTEHFKDSAGLRELSTQAEKLIRTQVENELMELLELDRRALEEFFTALFTDKKNWAALFSFIAGLVSGQEYLTAGAAIAALSSVAAGAFKSAADRRTRLRTSEYALLYTISRRT